MAALTAASRLGSEKTMLVAVLVGVTVKVGVIVLVGVIVAERFTVCVGVMLAVIVAVDAAVFVPDGPAGFFLEHACASNNINTIKKTAGINIFFIPASVLI